MAGRLGSGYRPLRYEPFGPLSEMTLGNGTRRHSTYDQRYRMQSNQLLRMANGQLIAGQSYGYDPAGNITSLGDQIDPAYSRSFGYDGLNRLVTANSGAALWGNGGFTYDAMGNMQTMTIGSRVTQFSYQGATPKLTTVDGQAVVYDPAGNEIDSW
jgi:hypothetical protein